MSIEIKNEQSELRLAYDTIFKGVFTENSDVLCKMIYDLTGIETTKGELMIGYETVPLSIKSKVYKGDILVKISEYDYILIEMNYRRDSSVKERNVTSLIRIANQVFKEGTDDKDLSNYRFILINFNNYKTKYESNKCYDKSMLRNDRGKVTSEVYRIYDISLAKCQKMVYNENVRKLPKMIRWGAIMLEYDYRKISKILGDDMLTREEKRRFIMTIKELKGKDRIMKDWMWEEHYRLKEQGELRTAREDGREEGKENTLFSIIKNMLKKGSDYSYISDITGKSIAEIKKIESNMQVN